VPEPARIHAFDRLAQRDVAPGGIPVGVRIAARRVGTMLDVRVRDASAAISLGTCVELPREPNAAVDAGAIRVLALGPDQWLLVCAQTLPAPANLLAGVTLTDVSHGRAVVRVAGPRVRDALAKGCALDLHPRVFPVARCAQTVIARIPLLLDHVDADAFDVYCPRSYADSYWHWLTEACEEYGCAIAPAD
jgi:sarcosine oxidase subunit gamma